MSIVNFVTAITLEFFSDTPSMFEFSKLNTSTTIWTDYKRINDTHFESQSLKSVVGKVIAPEKNFERFQKMCKQSWTQRWWGSASMFQSYHLVLSDLKGRLRYGFLYTYEAMVKGVF